VELRNTTAFDALKVFEPFLRIKKIQATAMLGLYLRPRFRVSPEEQRKRIKAYKTIRGANDGGRNKHNPIA